MGSDRDQTLAEHRGGLLDCARGHRPAAAPCRARAVARQRGVALNGADVVDVDTERIRRELHHRGLDAVPARAPGDVDVHRPGGLDANGGTLGAVATEARGRRLHERRRTDTEVPTGRARCGLLAAERVVVEDPECVLQGLERRDAVEHHAVGVRVRQVVLAQHVASPQLHRVDTQLPGSDVEQHLPRERLELPRPAVRGAALGVGEDAPAVEARERHPVRAREQRAQQPDGAHRCRRGTRAAIGDEPQVDGLDRAVHRRTPSARCRARGATARPP